MAEFYRITRVRPNGTETVLRDILFTSVTDEQLQRAAAFVDANQRKAGGLHIRVYSSKEDGSVSPDDLIWDSEINT